MYVHFSMMTMTEYMWTNLPPTLVQYYAQRLRCTSRVLTRARISLTTRIYLWTTSYLNVENSFGPHELVLLLEYYCYTQQLFSTQMYSTREQLQYEYQQAIYGRQSLLLNSRLWETRIRVLFYMDCTKPAGFLIQVQQVCPGPGGPKPHQDPSITPAFLSSRSLFSHL